MRNYFLWLAKTITLVFIFLFFVPIVLVATLGALANGSGNVQDDKKSVAVIKIDGVIEDSKVVVSELYKQSQDDNIKGIVLRINSPGGAVGPSQDIYSAVRKLKAKKPIVASMGTVAASGGFYAALGASKIFCQPGTLTGSVGVVLQIPNVKKLTDNVGFEMVTVKSGALKDVGNSFRDMTPEEQEFLQKTVDVVHNDFVQAIVEGRGIAREKVLPIADGRIIIGSQAKDLNLVDAYGDVYDAARSVFDILGEPLPEGHYPKLVYIEDKFESFKKILESATSLPQIFDRSFSLRSIMY